MAKSKKIVRDSWYTVVSNSQSTKGKNRVVNDTISMSCLQTTYLFTNLFTSYKWKNFLKVDDLWTKVD